MHRVSRHTVCCRTPDMPETWLWACVVLLFVALALFVPSQAGGDEQNVIGNDALPDLDRIEKAFQHIVEQVSPSVVGIRVQRRYMATLPAETETEISGTFSQLVTVNGAGTIIDRNGLILTNEHVIQSASEIEVFFHDGQSLPASVVAADARGDLAVLKVERRDLTTAAIADWSQVCRGQWTITLGNPYGLGSDGNLSVSIGFISNLGRKLPGLGEVDDRFYADMIQTTAAIHPGCSGGPLFNIQGQLVGVVTAMHTRAAADEGVGFAIPMTPARERVVQSLAAGNPITYGYLGVTVRCARQNEREAAGVDPELGAVVEQVDPASPASDVGLREGDLIVRFESQPVLGPGSLAELVGQISPGQSATIELWRDRQHLVVKAPIQSREVNHVSWMRGNAVLWRGMRLTDLTPDRRRSMGVDASATGVVVIDVVQNSAAERAAVQIGDVIESVAQTPIRDVLTFNAQVRGNQGSVKIRVHARGDLIVRP